MLGRVELASSVQPNRISKVFNPFSFEPERVEIDGNLEKTRGDEDEKDQTEEEEEEELAVGAAAAFSFMNETMNDTDLWSDCAVR